MLRELSVQNLAPIEDVRVELQPGFCVWTGETGAGKSAPRSTRPAARRTRLGRSACAGAEELRVTGRFELETAELRRQVEAVLNAPLEDDEIILSRRLTRVPAAATPTSTTNPSRFPRSNKSANCSWTSTVSVRASPCCSRRIKCNCSTPSAA